MTSPLLRRAGWIALALLLLYSRRPDAFRNPQFWAEDGYSWFETAYNQGWTSLAATEGGYVHLLPRGVALFSLWLPLAWAPALFNAVGLTTQMLPALFIASTRLVALIPRAEHRLLLAFLYLALPSSWEVHATLTQAVRHLALLSCLMLLVAPAARRLARAADLAALLACGVSGPFTLLLAPIAVHAWWRRGDRARAIAVLATALVQSIVLAIDYDSRRNNALGASAADLVRIFGGQVVIAGVLGQTSWSKLVQAGFGDAAAIAAALLIVPIAAWTVRRRPGALVAFDAYAALVFVAALAHPLVDETKASWPLLWLPGVGGRYWFIPITALLATLVCAARAASWVRWIARGFLILLPVGIVSDWSYPPLRDLHYRDHLRRLEAARPQEVVVIPIHPPGWTMRLVKR